MEGISEIPINRPETITTIEEKRIELMKSFFSSKTEIIPENDNVYRINTTLDNGDFCEGGQKMEVVFKVEKELFEPEKIKVKIEYPEYGLNTLKPVEIFKTVSPYIRGVIQSLKINGQEKVTPDIKVFFDSKESENGGSHFANNKGEITNRKFNNGDDIADYFHELGHIKRDKNDLIIKQSKKNQSYIKRLEEVGMFYKTTSRDFLAYKKRIYEERQASIKAIKMMSETDLVPNDHNLLGPKSLFANNLSTYIYVYKNRFDELAEKLKKEIPKILDLNQDWHY